MVGQLKIGDLSTQEQNKIFSCIDIFWPMAEELKVPEEKIDKSEKLTEQTLMGFLHPNECITEIKNLFGPSSKQGEGFIQKINFEIFHPLKEELAKMYNDFDSENKKNSSSLGPKTLAENLGFKK